MISGDDVDFWTVTPNLFTSSEAATTPDYSASAKESDRCWDRRDVEVDRQLEGAIVAVHGRHVVHVVHPLICCSMGVATIVRLGVRSGVGRLHLDFRQDDIRELRNRQAQKVATPTIVMMIEMTIATIGRLTKKLAMAIQLCSGMLSGFRFDRSGSISRGRGIHGFAATCMPAFTF